MSHVILETPLEAEGVTVAAFVEPKLIHGCGKVAHAERLDRGGRSDAQVGELLAHAVDVARAGSCYKVLVAAQDAEVAACEAAGFKDKGLQMIHCALSHPARPETTLSTLRMFPLPMGEDSPYILRRIAEGDRVGALKLLAQLTEVGEVADDAFNSFVALARGSDSLLTCVLEDQASSPPQVIGIATLLLVYAGEGSRSPSRAHIEDVVIDASLRGHGMGARMIGSLVRIGMSVGAPSVVLECSRHNEGFYIKQGFRRDRTSMALYL